MLTVREVLDRHQLAVHTITADASVQAAIQVMTSRRVSALPVVDGDRMIGIISERDYVRKVASQRIPAWSVQVGEIMTREVITVTPEDTIARCMRLMSENRIRHLPVMTGDRLTGILSITDVVRALDAAQSTS